MPHGLSILKRLPKINQEEKSNGHILPRLDLELFLVLPDALLCPALVHYLRIF